MRYEERPPCAALAPYVECFWLLTRPEGAGERPVGTPALEKVLPDGCPELILNRADAFHQPAEVPSPQIPLGLAGQIGRYIELGTPHRLDVVGIRFQPSGASAFFGPVLDEVTDHFVDPSDLESELGRALARELEAWHAPDERIRRLEHVLLTHLLPPTRADLLVRRAVARLVATTGALRIDELASELDTSTRHLGRLFRPRVGIAPKQLARILRFQSVFQALERGHDGWVDIALRAGYSDQAHLIHDFRDLAGDTPPCLVEGAGELTYCFTRSGRVSPIRAG